MQRPLTPASQVVCNNSTAIFTAAASGTPAPTIQWQQNTDGGVTFTNIAGANSTQLLVPTDGTQNGYRYRAAFTNWIGSATTAPATLTISSSVPPSVSLNPVSKTYTEGATAVFTAAANVTSPSVQWQLSTDGGAMFTNIGGATSTTLTFTESASKNGCQYRAQFSNLCGQATTSAATLTVRVFTDQALTAGFLIRSVHIQELRTHIFEQRTRFGLGAFPYTTTTFTAGVTPVRAVDISELREALRQTYVAAGRAVPVYADSTIVAGSTTIKAVHILELRSAVVALE